MIYDSQFKNAEIIRGWMELVRPPNLFTIPGDILAGASLARITREEMPLILPAMAVSFFLYISGLLLNDYCDRKNDLIERPLRPIPSGKVTPSSVLSAAIGLMVSALILALFLSSALWITLALIVLIVFYNGYARRMPLLGFQVMGLCRGANVVLGAAICKIPFTGNVFAGAGIETLYVAAVTSLASAETRGTSTSPLKLWLPFASLFTLFPLMYAVGVSPFGASMLLILLGWVFYISWKMTRDKRVLPGRISALIRCLILLQCAIIAISPGINPGYQYTFVLFLLLSLVASGLTVRKFYGS